MKIFIDLGAFDGDTIDIAIKKYKKLGEIHAFEPLTENFDKLRKKFDGKQNVLLINAAACTADGEGKLFLGKDWGDTGGSLCDNKSTCYKDRFENVKMLDFSKYVLEHFDNNDKKILKIDIEGKEYELLEKMMQDGSLQCIDELFCEWHFNRIGLAYEKHLECVKHLRSLGFNLTGDNKFDEFAQVWRTNSMLLQIERYAKYYITQSLKYCLAKRAPQVYSVLRHVYWSHQ
jgi:FkbM family methyltransferase